MYRMAALHCGALLLLISCLVYSVQAQLPNGGLLKVYILKGGNLTSGGPTCNSTDERTMNFRVHEVSSGGDLGEIPFFNRSDTTQTIFQRAILRSGFTTVLQLNVLNYNGSKLYLWCGPAIAVSHQLDIEELSQISAFSHFIGDPKKLGIPMPGKAEYMEGETLPPIICRARSGNPTENKIKLVINYDDGRKVNVPPSRLGVDFPLVSSRNSSGTYTCIGGNQANPDPVRSTLHLKLRFAPDLSKTVRLHEAAEGSRFSLPLVVISDPGLSGLTVKAPHSSVMSLLHQYLARAPGGQLRFAEHHVSLFNTSALDPSHGGAYTVEARNIIKGRNHTTSITIHLVVLRLPGTPRNVKHTSLDSSTISLAYDQPEDIVGAPAITGFRLMCQSRSASTGHILHTATAESVGLNGTVTGLHPGRVYQCSVVARNRAGDGRASLPVTIHLANGPPCEAEATQDTEAYGRVLLRFRFPCDGGAPSSCHILREPEGAFVGNIDTCRIGKWSNITDRTTVLGETYNYTFVIKTVLGTVAFTLVTTAPVIPPNSTATYEEFPTSAPSGGLSASVIAGAVCGGLAVSVIIVALVAKALIANGFAKDVVPAIQRMSNPDNCKATSSSTNLSPYHTDLHATSSSDPWPELAPEI